MAPKYVSNADKLARQILGWLTYEGAWLVTAAGEEVGRPSRAGVKTKRKRL
jgi:hypothetical protein